MSLRCTVCSHEAIEDIDRALVRGVRHVALCERYNLSKYAVSRHSKAHLPAKLRRAQEAEEVAEADNLLGLVQEQLATARRVAKQAEKAGEQRTVLLAVRELLRIVELEAKLAGALSDAPQVNVVLAPQWLALRAVVLEALGPYPDARVAVAGRLLALEGEA